jgi:DNA repair protein RadD
MLQPRSYQIEAVNSLYAYFATQQGNPVLALPTGTGKSVIIAMFLQTIYHQYPSQRVMVLTHVKELIQQNYEKLMTLWPGAPAGIYSAGLNRKDTHRKITFAGIGSVAKKADQFGHIDIVVVDEAHMVSPSDETLYQKFLADLRTFNPHIKVIGLTATPWRLGTGQITEDGIFTDICFDITGLHAFNRLIAEGFLAPLIPRQTKQMLDVDGIHMRGGEFIQSELQHAVDKQEVTFAAIKEAMELAHDRRHWLVFASGVEHACNIAEMMNDMGIPTVAIHSKMGDAERDAAIRDFKLGKYRAAVNNNVLTTGFDFPAIDCIVVLRPTASTVLWVQMLGRGTRPFQCDEYKKENCLVLDFAGNTRRLGPINDPMIPRKKGDKAGGEAPVKLCGACATYNHASVTHCSYCGAEFSFQVKIKMTAASDQLLRGDAPVVELFKVDHITYSRHDKAGRPPMMKVTYYCGLRSFNEYVCVEHDGFAQRKARHWWRERSKAAFPESTDGALEVSDTVMAATHLRIWINKQYPEIMAHCFDGKAFGTQEVPSVPPTTDASVRSAARLNPLANTANSGPSDIPEPAVYEGDDIPF